jgi:hypothetical protein
VPRLVAFALVVLVLALSACGGSDSAEPSEAFTAAELRWIESWLGWRDSVADLYGELGRAQGQLLTDARGAEAGYRRVLARLAGCGESLAARVPQPPSRRLAPVRSRSRAICVQSNRVAEAERRMAARPNPEAYLASQRAFERATVGLRAAESLLAARSVDGRRLRAATAGAASHVDPVLTEAGRDFVGSGAVEIRCWAHDDWVSVLREEEVLSRGTLTLDSTGAFVSEGRAHLQVEDCDALTRWRTGAEVEDGDAGYALLVLAHELQHLVAPGASEAATECAALQTADRAAELLGRTAADARPLVHDYLDEVYTGLPAEYRSGECRDGGALDLDPGSTAWP